MGLCMRKLNTCFIFFISLVAGFFGGELREFACTAYAQGSDVGLTEVVTQSLKIVDVAGNIRAELEAVGNKMPGLLLYDANKKARVSISLELDGSPSVTLYDAKMLPRGSFRLDTDGMPSINFGDSVAQIRSSFQLQKSGSPLLLLADANGKRKCGLMVDENSFPALAFYDSDAISRLVLGVISNKPGLMFFDPAGEVLDYFPKQ